VKSTSITHLRDNSQVDDFAISKDDIELLDSWDKKVEGSIRMYMKKTLGVEINRPPVPWLINTTDE